MPTKETIIKIRALTGAGIMDINEALENSGGDEAKAIEFLRKKGQKIASERSQRSAGEGYVGSYVHSNGKLSAQVKLQCETDFVGRNDEFRVLAKDLAMHIAASNPKYLKREDVPVERIEKEKEIYLADESIKSKPAEVVEKIVQGRLDKFYEEICLLDQIFIKDDSKRIKDLISEATTKIGEKIEITEFYRMEI